VYAVFWCGEGVEEKGVMYKERLRRIAAAAGEGGLGFNLKGVVWGGHAGVRCEVLKTTSEEQPEVYEGKRLLWRGSRNHRGVRKPITVLLQKFSSVHCQLKVRIRAIIIAGELE